MRLVANGTIAVLDPLVDEGISRAVARTSDLSAYDPRILTHFCPWIPTGGVVVDGGAFIGDHTVPYADAVGSSGEVWAFEPSPEALNCLVFNTQHLRQVRVVTAALGSAVMTVTLARRAKNAGGTAIHEEDADGVPVVPLDAFIFHRLDLLKLDVEGYELHALRGAEETIRRHHPVIIAESGAQLARYGDSPEALVSFLQTLGYDNGTRLPLQHGGADVYDVLFRPLSVM